MSIDPKENTHALNPSTKKKLKKTTKKREMRRKLLMT
jgi:hypothetical protein